MSTTFDVCREQVKQFNWRRVIGDAPAKAANPVHSSRGEHAHDLATILDRKAWRSAPGITAQC